MPSDQYDFNRLAYYLSDNDSKSLLVVEDCFSAIRASVHRDAAAILGTNLNGTKLLDAARNYDSITLALDKDATAKAFRLQREFSSILPIKVLPLEKDLKNLSEDELKIKLGEITT